MRLCQRAGESEGEIARERARVTERERKNERERECERERGRERESVRERERERESERVRETESERAKEGECECVSVCACVRESAREGEWRERDARAFGLSRPPSAPAQELSPLQISNGNTGMLVGRQKMCHAASNMASCRGWGPSTRGTVHNILWGRGWG